MPAPSPTQLVKQDFSLSNVELSYSRPAIKGRTIMGDIVPYGKVWRTGANSATTITFGEDVKFGGVAVKAGKYGLVTIPGPKQWTVILSSNLNITKPADYKQEEDVARVTANVVNLPFSEESFTIAFEKVLPSSMIMAISWDKTKVPVEIIADNKDKIIAQLNEAMQGDKKPYFQAAMFYADEMKDVKKAVEYIDQAAAQSPDAFWVFYQQARIHALAKDYKTAKAAALKSTELAKAAKSDDYVALNKRLLATMK